MNNHRLETFLSKYGIAISSLLVLIASFGIWGAGIPLGDEAGHISSAIRMNEEGMASSNPYYIFYAGILKFISSDPVVAHTICRFITSLAASILMFIFLRSFNFIRSPLSILLAVSFWISCRLNVPLVQFGNINLFCLCIVFPSLILIVRKITVNRSLFFLLSLFWAAKVRPEYYAPFVLFSIYIVGYSAFRIKNLKLGWNNIFKTFDPITAVIAVLMISSVLCTGGQKKERSFDNYLRLGLDQCYTSLYSKLHPEKKISTMVEYREVTDEVFGPGDFTDAFLHNPSEVVKYLALNGAINSTILIPSLIRHRVLFIPESYGKKGEIVQILFFLAIFLYGTFLGLKKNLRKPFAGNIAKSVILLLFKNEFIILYIFASASVVSIFLLIPDARYWINFIPIIFLWIAWSIDSIISKFLDSKFKIPVSFFIIIALCYPLFLFRDGSGDIIRGMRERVGKNSPTQPVIAGLYPSSLSIFAFKNNQKSVSVGEFKTESIKSGEYDFLAIDSYFRDSSFWNKNSDFLNEFEKNPGNYKYELIGTTNDKYRLYVYYREKGTLRSNQLFGP